MTIENQMAAIEWLREAWPEALNVIIIYRREMMRWGNDSAGIHSHCEDSIRVKVMLADAKHGFSGPDAVEQAIAAGKERIKQ